MSVLCNIDLAHQYTHSLDQRVVKKELTSAVIWLLWVGLEIWIEGTDGNSGSCFPGMHEFF